MFNLGESRLNKLLTFSILAASSFGVQSQESVTEFRTEFVYDYCTECHNSIDYSGSLDFWEMDIANVHVDSERWEKVF